MKAPDFWYQPNGSPPFFLGPFLKIAQYFYQKTAAKRQQQTAPYKSRLPVICVGNITAGGSGKTPTVQSICHLLASQGHRPAILMRGYGGKLDCVKVDHESHDYEQVGDEALQHAQYFPTYIAKNRTKGAQLIEQSDEGISAIVMDDGFQNPTLHKDISIVVVNGADGFGNGQLIPIGPLREPILSGLKRADACLIIGDDTYFIGKKYQYLLPTFHAEIDSQDSAHSLPKDRPYEAFAGIGRPQKFLDSLKKRNFEISRYTYFPDHFQYKRKQLLPILKRAEKNNHNIITTEKDFQRLPLSPDERAKINVLKITLNLPLELQRLLKYKTKKSNT